MGLGGLAGGQALTQLGASVLRIAIEICRARSQRRFRLELIATDRLVGPTLTVNPLAFDGTSLHRMAANSRLLQMTSLGRAGAGALPDCLLFE